MTGADPSLSAAAIRGTAWTTAQTVANKACVLGASLVLARLLDPADYGIAFIATTVGAFFFVLAPWVLNDLLVSDPRGFTQNAGTALVAGMGTALALAVLMVLSIPWLRVAAPDSKGFGVLLAIVALRPIADAWMAVPWAALRLRLQYARLALIDGTAQLAGTLAAVAMAMIGAGPMTLVLPPIAVLFLQGAAYWVCVRGTIPLHPQRSAVSPVMRRFTVAAASQYLNNVVKILELLLLTWLSSAAAVGLFAFAFQLSSQANTIIANQISGVIQPILSHINDQPVRQFRAFVRALRLLGCVGIPLSVIQGALAAPLFRTFFGTKWDGAIPIFLVLSLMQAFIFVATPIMVLLKAQGRFRLILAWQLAHVVAGGAAIAGAARYGSEALAAAAAAAGLPVTADTSVPLAAAAAGAAAWGLGCPIALKAGGRAAGAGWGQVLLALGQPWPSALLAGAISLAVPTMLRPMIGSIAANITALVLAIPLSAGSIWLAAASSTDTRHEMRTIAGGITRKLRGRSRTRQDELDQ